MTCPLLCSILVCVFNDHIVVYYLPIRIQFDEINKFIVKLIQFIMCSIFSIYEHENCSPFFPSILNCLFNNLVIKIMEKLKWKQFEETRNRMTKKNTCQRQWHLKVYKMKRHNITIFEVGLSFFIYKFVQIIIITCEVKEE